MKKTIIWIVIIVVIVGGGYYAYKMHKSQQLQNAVAQQAQIEAQHKQTAQAMKPSGTAKQSDVVMMSKETGVLTDAKGMTVYTYDKDTKNTSTCTGGCAKAWPPFLVSSGAMASSMSELGMFKLADGSMQYTWKGMPLYYYVGDKKAGDTSGDGVGGVWHVVK